MIRLREYKKGDLEAIGEAVEPFYRSDKLGKYDNQGLFMTMELNGTPVATGGLILSDEDTAEAWIKVSKKMLVENNVLSKIRLLKSFSEALDVIDECLEFPMVYTAVLDGFERGEKFAEFLGFVDTDQTADIDGRKYNYYQRKLK